MKDNRVIETKTQEMYMHQVMNERRLSQIMVTSKSKTELVRYAKIILQKFRDGLHQNYELHGYGKDHCLGVEKVCRMIQEWIDVKEVKTGQRDLGESYIIVMFSPTAEFHAAWKKSKEKARFINKRKEDKKARPWLKSTISSEFDFTDQSLDSAKF